MFLTSIFLVGMNAAGELKPGQQQFPLTSQGWTLGAGFSVVTSLSWPGEPENCKNSNKIASKRKRRHFNWSRVPGRRKCKKCYKAEHNAHCDNIVPHPGVRTLTSVTVSQQHPLCTAGTLQQARARCRLDMFEFESFDIDIGLKCHKMDSITLVQSLYK